MRLSAPLLAAFLMLGAALRAEAPAPAPAAAPTQQASPAPAEVKKLVFAFQKQKDPRKTEQDARKLAAELQKDLGLEVEVLMPASYGATVQALISNKAQVAYVSSIPYLLARREAPMQILVAEKRAGKTDYDSIFVVPKDSPVKTLADLKGRRMMFTSTTSTSGYLFPVSRLVQEKHLTPKQDPREFFSEVGFAGGYDRALLAVANGQADVCAVSDYTMEGAKADLYAKPEVRAKLRVLERTPGVPTHLVCARGDLPAELSARLRAALLRISTESPALLADVYGAGEFTEVRDEAHVARTVQAASDTGFDLGTFVK